MRQGLLHIVLLMTIIPLMLSCGRMPRGVMSVNQMADLIVDLQLADAYIENHAYDFDSDSSKMVIKQSIFKKHGITQQDYDSSLVWYAHNMEDYVKAYDKAIVKLKNRYDKFSKTPDGSMPNDMITEGAIQGAPTHDAAPKRSIGIQKMGRKRPVPNGEDAIDLWTGKRNYTLAQGARRGFITFDFTPDANGQRGDRYQLSYLLSRFSNEFKVSLNVDYTDGGTSQITRGTNSDGWVTIDLQSDSTRQVRRIYGYVSYDIKHGHTAFVDSLSLFRTHMNKNNYGLINAQRHFERK